MLFKNLLFYRMTKPLEKTGAEIESLLAQSAFVPCGSQDVKRSGFVSPCLTGELLLSVDDCHLLCVRTQEKVLPGGAIAEALETKVAEIEKNEARKVYRKERKQLKEEILLGLSAKALTRSKRMYAYLDLTSQLLVVDTGSAPRAEEFLTQLRNTLGSLPVQPVQVQAGIPTVLTSWINACAKPAKFSFGEKCDLRDHSASANTVRMRAQDLQSEEVGQHLAAGKQVIALELGWDLSSIEFVLDEKLVVRRLRFADELIKSAYDGVDDQQASESADFLLLTLTVDKFLADLLNAFGGELQP
jgi:recombination associated protein RdgC